MESFQSAKKNLLKLNFGNEAKYFDLGFVLHIEQKRMKKCP